MTGSIEIYVRPAAGGPIINIYVPQSYRERFFERLREAGSVSSQELPINFEMTVLQGWTEQDLGTELGPHVRLSATGLNILFQE